MNARTHYDRYSDPGFRNKERERARAYQKALRILKERHVEEFEEILDSLRRADGNGWAA